MTGKHYGAETFRPAPWLPGRHLQTILPSVWPAAPVAGRAERMVVPVARSSAVQLEINHPQGRSRGTLLLVHGMGGSAESGYMRRTAVPALERGWTVVRMNLRNCGGTEALSRTLYNAGQSGDLGRVLEALDQARFLHPKRGGHCGYWQASGPRFWAAGALLRSLERTAGTGSG